MSRILFSNRDKQLGSLTHHLTVGYFLYSATGSPCLTCQYGQPPHCRERVVPRCVQDVQLVHVSPDVVNLAMKILNGGSVLVLKPASEKARDNGALPHPGGSQHNHAVGVLGWHIEGAIPTGHSLHHCLVLEQTKQKQKGLG